MQDPGSYPEVHPRSASGGAAGRPPAGQTGTIVFLHGGNVANWMWDPQVRALADFQVLTPNLPGFGGKAGEEWVSLEATADAVAAFIAEHTDGGPVHVVGLSLGAVVALHLAARHPELASSVLVSGTVVARVGGLARSLAALQFVFWDKEWFWRAQAKAFGLPADSVELYVRHGLTVRSENAQRMLQQVYAGRMPHGLERFGNRVLAVAGEKEPALVAGSFALLAARLPLAEFRLAPGMHHVWNVENDPLFSAMVRQWAAGSVHPGLAPRAGSTTGG
jgi:pimeloyl-ACP methyl ester carboxylesterase